MRGIIVALGALSIITGPALASCPAVRSDCPSPTFNSPTMNGFTSFDGTIVSNRTVTDPSGENISIQSVTLENLTTGDNANDVLSFVGQMAINPKGFHSTAQHEAGVYGHTYGTGDNAGGIIDYAPGVIGMAGNQGLGTVAVAASFLSHIPDILAGGSVTAAYALYDQGCTSGTHATACYGAYFQHNVGVGTAAPAAAFDDQTGNGVSTTGTLTSVKAGTNIQYALFKQDGSTTIGQMGRPLNTNDIELGGYADVVLTPNKTAAGLVQIGGGTPTIASGACGATTNGSVSGNNNVGHITIGSAATVSCVVTFSGTMPAAPTACVFSPTTAASAAGTVLAYISAKSTTGFTLSGSALATTQFDYHCI